MHFKCKTDQISKAYYEVVNYLIKTLKNIDYMWKSYFRYIGLHYIH